MLCQFTVKNFKSIRDAVTFDMQATAISEHEDRIIKDKDEELYLPVSAVYGLMKRRYICVANKLTYSHFCVFE